MRFHNICRKLGAGLIGVALSAQVNAAPEGDVQVDVLVFAQPDRGASVELWRNASQLQVEFPDGMIDFDGKRGRIDERFSDLGTSASPRLKQAADRLDAASYRILAQTSWRQPLPANGEAAAILLEGGKPFGEHHELEGYLQLTRQEQRVGVETHLWLSSMKPSAVTMQGIATLPAQQAAPEEDIPFELTQLMQLKDTRTVNSGEWNYIDHPKLGVLVEIRPVQALDAASTAP